MDARRKLLGRKETYEFLEALPKATVASSNFPFAESTVLRLKVNCKTVFVVILNGVCLLALNTVKPLFGTFPSVRLIEGVCLIEVTKNCAMFVND